MELNDELLCAYIDGELDAEQRARIEQALALDGGGRQRVARMRAADERLRTEIPVRGNSANDPIADFILRESAGVNESRPRSRPHAWRNGLAIAAGCSALALGFVLARVGGNSQEVADGFASGALQSTLEHARSGGPLANETGAASVLLTVNAADGRYCRLYRLRAAAGVTEGVACREDARWRVVAFDAVEAAEGFHTAGASPLIDAALDQLGGETLAAQAESAALARDWRAP